MSFLFIIGLVFLGAAAALIARAVAITRLRMAAQVRQISTYGFAGDTANEALAEARSQLSEGINSLAERVGRFAQARVQSLEPLPRPQLTSAGFYVLTPDAFHGYRVLASTLLPELAIVAVVAAGGTAAGAISMAAVTAALSWLSPGIFIRLRGRKRLDRIDRELPELIDVLTATVEAGLGFAGALQLAADRFKGPLGTELRFMQQEQRMGLSTDQALANMVERCETPSIRAFVRAVLQGESLGVSIGTMMRNLATETRKRRRQAAFERVQKAPVKLLFPLVFMMFPALLVVLIYPAAHQLLTQLGTG
jgi:tight adherence protein C